MSSTLMQVLDQDCPFVRWMASLETEKRKLVKMQRQHFYDLKCGILDVSPTVDIARTKEQYERLWNYRQREILLEKITKHNPMILETNKEMINNNVDRLIKFINFSFIT